jgi:hypothetical protein
LGKTWQWDVAAAILLFRQGRARSIVVPFQFLFYVTRVSLKSDTTCVTHCHPESRGSEGVKYSSARQSEWRTQDDILERFFLNQAEGRI